MRKTALAAVVWICLAAVSAASALSVAVFDVPAGKTTELAIGSPLSAAPSVSQQSGTVSFRAKLVDAGGTDVDSIQGANGKRPEAPSVIVYNAKDEQVYQGKMKYG